eukprot:TRINITY_DN6334_c0_g1_i1.p2 TRINITY_DN6334_c0_g1~~TRINITY_DN6334_c0_g1_i1.p2  ORF type:complete len:192 (-),score=8.78 TRINITY_DN6334_c0_g1_i1:302-802(-)
MGSSYPFSPGQPLFSLATQQSSAGPATMNIMGYISQINMNPPKMALSLYNGTQSKQNMLQNQTAVLQVLGEQHAELVPLLGTQSGRDIDKLAELKRLGFELEKHWGIYTLKDIVGVMQVRTDLSLYPVTELGDHGLFICDIVDSKTINGSMEPLYRRHLTERGILV